MTNTQKLINKLNEIYSAHKDEISNAAKWGPRGGRNARDIPDWMNVGNATLSRAIDASYIPTMDWFSGYRCRPVFAIPTCVWSQCWDAYGEVFGQAD